MQNWSSSVNQLGAYFVPRTGTQEHTAGSNYKTPRWEDGLAFWKVSTFRRRGRTMKWNMDSAGMSDYDTGRANDKLVPSCPSIAQ